MTPTPSPTDSLLEPLTHGWDGPVTLTVVLTAIATIIGICTYQFQHRAHRSQAQTELTRRRRSQAALITFWHEEDRGLIWVENRSDQPIHDVSITLQQLQPNVLGPSTLHGTGGIFRTIPPHHKVRHAPWNYLIKRTPTLTFRDAQGVTWKRDDRSDLVELDQDVWSYYEVGPPERYNYLMDRPEPL